MVVSTFVLLVYMGGGVGVLLVKALSIPIDYLAFRVELFNFVVVGVFSIFLCKVPIIFT